MPRNFLPSLRAPQRGNLYGYFLPKALIHISLKIQDNKIFLQVHDIKHIPDPDHYYTFSYKPSANAEDDIVVKYGSDGFLSQVHTQIDDQTDEVISSLADILGSLTEVASPAKTTSMMPTNMKARSLGAKEVFNGTIDPFSEDDMGALNKLVKAEIGDNFNFEARILGNQGEQGASGTESEKSGIFCKPRAIVEIGIFGEGGKETEIVQVPHPNLLEFIEIPSARFVKTEFEITFTKEGYPNYIHVNKPSSVLAFIQAPLAIIKAIVAIPASIFQFRINLDNMKSQAIKSEYDYRKAVFDYGNRLKELEQGEETADSTTIASNDVKPGAL